MFGLRKRAKLVDFDADIGNEIIALDEQHSTQSKPLNFSSLPIEVQFLIFDLLSPKDLLKMRSVNTEFKWMVESYGPLWKKSSIKLNFDKKSQCKNAKTEIELLKIFINRVPHIHTVELICKKKLTKQEFMGATDKQWLNLTKKYTFILDKVNIQSIDEYLFLVSNSCKQIEIKSFYDQNEQFKPISSSGLTAKYNNDLLLKCTHVKRLRINCILYDSCMNSYAIDLKIFENILFARMDQFFPNLTHLQLKNYVDSPAFLFSNVQRLSNLKYLEILSSFCKTKFYLDTKTTTTKRLDKLKLETLILIDSSFDIIQTCLKELTDLKCLKHLSIMQNTPTTIFNNSNLEKLLDVLVRRATSLQSIYSDIFEEILFKPTTYTLARKLFCRLENIALASNIDMSHLFDDHDSFVCSSVKLGNLINYSNNHLRFDMKSGHFNKLFLPISGEEVENGMFVAEKVIFSIGSVYFCFGFNNNYIEDFLKHALIDFRKNANHLKQLEIHFNCSRNVSFNKCRCLNYFKFLANFNLLKKFNHVIDYDRNLIKFNF